MDQRPKVAAGAGVSWLRLDDGFAAHPKIAALTDREFRVWMRVLCYCARLQDPTVDDVTLREVPGLNRRVIAKLCDLELLDDSGDDYEVHDWTVYAPKDLTNAERQARYRARRNAVRNGMRNGKVTDETVTETVTDPSRAEAGTRAQPVPSPSTSTGAVDAASPSEQHGIEDITTTIAKGLEIPW